MRQVVLGTSFSFFQLLIVLVLVFFLWRFFCVSQQTLWVKSMSKTFYQKAEGKKTRGAYETKLKATYIWQMTTKWSR
jgi:hypothetical protein